MEPRPPGARSPERRTSDISTPAGAASTTPLQWVDGLGGGLAAYVLYRLFGEVLSLRHFSAELRRRFA